MQPVARPAGQAGQGRGARRGRLPAGVRHDLGLRRHLDGPRRHALLAGVPRDHRRLGRDGVPRRAARRRRAAGRLRQVAARHADGRRPARRRRGVPLRRLDPAGQARRPRRDDHRRVRGGRRLPGRQDHAATSWPRSRGRSARRGRLRRHVHRQHDGLGGRGAGHVAARAARRRRRRTRAATPTPSAPARPPCVSSTPASPRGRS